MKKTIDEIQEEFMKDVTKDKSTYNCIFNTMKTLNINIYEFNNVDLDNVLNSFGSISVNSLNKYLQFVREIIKFVLPGEKIQPTKKIDEYVDYKRLLSKTIIFPMDYSAIKNQITISVGEIEYNMRDKVLFCLSCLGLTNNEMKNLKKSDVEFATINDKNCCVLHFNTRTVTTTDKELIDDIKVCMKERYYLRIESTGKEMEIRYKDTPYLIRPIETNSSDNETIANPSLTLKKVLNKIYHRDLDMEHISIEDIRRSLIFYWMGSHNAREIDVADLLSKKTRSDLIWLKNVAKKIYNEK